MARAEPFEDAPAAWFWTVEALAARRDGTGAGSRTPRPCDPDDVLRTLDALYRRGKIGAAHASTLRRYGNAGRAPNPIGEAADARLWAETMEALAAPLLAKGIIANGGAR